MSWLTTWWGLTLITVVPVVGGVLWLGSREVSKAADDTKMNASIWQPPPPTSHERLDRRRGPLLKLLPALVGCLTAILVGALIVIAPGVVGGGVFAVPSGNMERTLPVGSFIAVREQSPTRGDIVVHRGEPIPGLPESFFVKRVVALGGDRIGCCAADGSLTLNGQTLDEPYVFEDDARPFGPVEVPPGRAFMLGDHRSQSRDSRSYLDDEHSGTVAVEAVIGVASGPYSRSEARRRVLRDAAPYPIAAGLAAGVLAALVATRRGRSPNDPAPALAARAQRR